MKKKAASLLVLALTVPAFIGMPGCKTRPPDPPAKKVDSPDPVDPLIPSTPTPSPGSDGTNVSINITPLAVDSFSTGKNSGVWINTKKIMNWNDAKTTCSQYGLGWDLPSLAQVADLATQLSKATITADPAKPQPTDGLMDGSYWTLTPDSNGKYCVQATKSIDTTCNGFQPASGTFKVLCYNPKATP